MLPFELSNTSDQLSCIWAMWLWRPRFLYIFLCISIVQTRDLVSYHMEMRHTFTRFQVSGLSMSFAVLEKEIFKSMLFRNPKPCRRVVIDSGAAIWFNFIEVYKAMFDTKFQVSGHSCSEEENFDFLSIKHSATWDRAIFDTEATIWTKFVNYHKEMLHIKFAVLKIKISNYIV